jgi:putative ABC transport system permease protein
MAEAVSQRRHLSFMALLQAPVRPPHRASFQKTLDSAKRTMVLSEIILLALDSFRASKVRFALTALGMVIGSASLILVVTIGLTGKEYILKEIQGIGTNMIMLEYSGGGVGAVKDSRNDYMTRDDESAVMEQVPAVAASSPMLEMHDRIAFPGGILKDVLVLGVSPEYADVRNLIITSGRFFDNQDEETHTKAAVVTEPFARERFGSIDAAINQNFELSGIPFTIVGTFKERVDTFGQSEIDDETILIPYSVGRYFTGTDYVKQLFFSVRDQNH